jgi:hypothetical protein
MVYYSVTEDDDHAIGAWMPRNDVGFQTVTVIGQCLFWSLMTPTETLAAHNFRSAAFSRVTVMCYRMDGSIGAGTNSLIAPG